MLAVSEHKNNIVITIPLHRSTNITDSLVTIFHFLLFPKTFDTLFQISAEFHGMHASQWFASLLLQHKRLNNSWCHHAWGRWKPSSKLAGAEHADDSVRFVISHPDQVDDFAMRNIGGQNQCTHCRCSFVWEPKTGKHHCNKFHRTPSSSEEQLLRSARATFQHSRTLFSWTSSCGPSVRYG